MQLACRHHLKPWVPGPSPGMTRAEGGERVARPRRPCEERSDAAIQGLGSRLNGEDSRDLLGRRVAALLAMTEGGRPGTEKAARGALRTASLQARLLCMKGASLKARGPRKRAAFRPPFSCAFDPAAITRRRRLPAGPWPSSPGPRRWSGRRPSWRGGPCRARQPGHERPKKTDPGSMPFGRGRPGVAIARHIRAWPGSLRVLRPHLPQSWVPGSGPGMTRSGAESPPGRWPRNQPWAQPLPEDAGVPRAGGGGGYRFGKAADGRRSPAERVVRRPPSQRARAAARAALALAAGDQRVGPDAGLRSSWSMARPRRGWCSRAEPCPGGCSAAMRERRATCCPASCPG